MQGKYITQAKYPDGSLHLSPEDSSIPLRQIDFYPNGIGFYIYIDGSGNLDLGTEKIFCYSLINKNKLSTSIGNFILDDNGNLIMEDRSNELYSKVS